MAGSTILGKLQIMLGSDTSEFDKSIDRVNKKMGAFGAKMTKIGSELTTKVSAPIAAIGGAAVYMTAQFDDSMSKVSALSGATGSELESLRDLAKKMGSETAHSASTAADAMQYLALAGYDTNQILSATPAMLSLASAAGMDLAQSADIVTDTMSAFQMQAEEAGKAADIFATAQAKSNTNVEQLGEALKYAAPAANAFQQNLEQTSAILGVFADSGIKGSMAGTTFVSMLEDLKKSSKDGAVSIGKTSIALYDAEGNARAMADILEDIEGATKGMTTAQRDAALASVFQTRSLKGVNVMMATGSKRLRELEKELYNSEGAAAKMAGTMEDNLGGSLRSLRSATEGVLISFGEVLAPAVRGLADMLKGLMHWFDSLSATTKKWIVIVAGVAAAIGPALLALGAISSMIPVLISGFLALLGPVGLFVGALAGIGGLVGGITALNGGFSSAKEKADEATKAYEKQKQKVNDLGKSLGELLPRHDELKKKTNRSKEENRELKEIIQKISEVVPGAVTEFDKYGKALTISSDAVRKMYENEKVLARFLNDNEIEARRKELEGYKKELEGIEKTISRGTKTERTQTKGFGGEIKYTFTPRDLTNEEKLALGQQAEKLQENIRAVQLLIDKKSGIDQAFENSTGVIKENTDTLEGNTDANKEQAAALSLLAQKQKELKEAQEARNNVKQGDYDGLARANQRVEAIQKEIEWLNNLQITGDEVYRGMAAAASIGIAPIEIKWKLADAMKGWDNAIKNIVTDKDLGIDALKRVQQEFSIAEQSARVFGNSFDEIGEKTRAVDNAIQGLLSQKFSADSPFIQSLLQMRDEVKSVTGEITTSFIDLSGMVQSALVGVGDAIGNALSNMDGDLSGMEIFFNGIIDVVSGFLATLGQQLIAAGVASEAFKKLGATGLPAIAAGVALIALSKVVGNTLSKSSLGGGSGGGGAISGGGNASPGKNIYAERAPITVQGDFTLKGQDLHLAMKNQERKMGRTG